jgi:hypothetical protein
MRESRRSDARRQIVGMLVASLLVCGVAACAAGESVSQPPSSGWPSGGASSAPSELPPNASATESAAPLPTAADTEAPPPTPTPTAPTGPLPSLSARASGPWTGLDWIALPTGHSPTIPNSGDDSMPQLNLFGWSGGYVEFIWNAAARTVTPWSSADGLTWTAGPNLSIGGLVRQIPADGVACDFEMTDVVQGPSTLMGQGRIVCAGATCGPPWYSSQARWLSRDGLAWGVIGTQPEGAISGGPSGYVSVNDTSLWISDDGKTWRGGTLPQATLAEDTGWNSASFGGGFVLATTVYWPGGCGSAPGTKIPAVWWSSDGNRWSREDLPGAVVADGVDTEVTLIAGDALLVREYSTDYNGGTDTVTAWTSRDGRSWQPLATDDTIWNAAILTDGSRCVVVGVSTDGSQSKLQTFDSNLRLVGLRQSGDVPQLAPWSWAYALGPSGLLVSQDGSRSWLGVPTSD